MISQKSQTSIQGIGMFIIRSRAVDHADRSKQPDLANIVG